ncbi:Hypothetical protein SRAE_X000165800 [Strongyloides ratti]|uniref:Uncharacterized protein n=1 Tax=Strongyloides ratti TaxID=34506 RepID=A0A090KVL8_STRRB|nr:Hypothetical protein SRAE_X000165800 [Strongyloides ratti]CEF59915.1 Hypothetical protein SRAE_X000165800 [Strongyloides ratti]
MTFSDGWGKRSSKNHEDIEIKKENNNVNNELETYISGKCMLQYTNDINKILTLMSNSYSRYELCRNQLNYVTIFGYIFLVFLKADNLQILT